MNLMRALAVALSCFSVVPMPQLAWEDRPMRYMLCFFPVVGIIIGAALFLWQQLIAAADLGTILWAAGLALIPIAITGGIHLDGFADVIDAQSSHAPAKRKRQILKDPHVGAFAIIGVVAYVLAYFALATELPAVWQLAVLLGIGHVASRCSSGIATLITPKSSDDGMVAQFQISADKRVVVMVLIVELLACVVCASLICLPAGMVLFAVCAVGILCIRAFAMRAFEGMSGDIAGFYLQLVELVLLIGLVIVVKAVGL